jgi:hypothetical protein
MVSPLKIEEEAGFTRFLASSLPGACTKQKQRLPQLSIPGKLRRVEVFTPPLDFAIITNFDHADSIDTDRLSVSSS